MEFENANRKRGRESLSSLEENDLPSMTRTTKKCITSITKFVNNVSAALSAEGAQGGEEEGDKHQRPPDGGSNSLGGAPTKESLGGAGVLQPKPPERPPIPTPRSGSSVTSTSGVGRDRSPIKPP